MDLDEHRPAVGVTTGKRFLQADVQALQALLVPSTGMKLFVMATGKAGGF